jgi:outer membrane protein assembly factor BamB
LGVDTAPLIINGTIYAVTQYDQAFALNAANGNVLWTVVLPITANSTAGKGVGAVSLHLHDGNEQFTTKLFNHTPTWWISASDWKVYALNALTGAYELNFTVFTGTKSVDGNGPNSVYHGTGTTNVLVDENKGVAITSIISTNVGDTGRCFFRGWNILVSPPQLMWTSYCTPPQPQGNLAVDPNWEITQVNSMKGAQIFYPGPAYNNGGPIPGTAVVDLKKLSPSVLNSTLYDDWGYVNQTPECRAYSGGQTTGSTAAGWGAPWLLGTGPTAGLAFLNTNNKDPYAGPCTPGPALWSAAIMALNETTGQWVWGFQSAAHEIWDYDCSWWQGLGNETVNGVNTQVLWKTCKAGYLFELNAQTGGMIWAWTPPLSIENRCPYCYMLNPLNRTEMTRAFFNPSLQPTICTPCTFAIESEGAYNPALNYIFLASINYPALWNYVPPNSTNYHTNGFTFSQPIPGYKTNTGPQDNATVEAVNAATGQMVWSHFIPAQGYRGGMITSGNIVYLTLSSGDLMMLNAKTGDLVKDYYIGGPLNVHASIGATAGGQMMLVLPITAGLVSWGTGVPGDLVALTLQNVPLGTTNTITTSVTVSGLPATTTSVTTVTAAGGGVDTTTAYGVAAVAVIFIIATGYLAMRGRKPAS